MGRGRGGNTQTSATTYHYQNEVITKNNLNTNLLPPVEKLTHVTLHNINPMEFFQAICCSTRTNLFMTQVLLWSFVNNLEVIDLWSTFSDSPLFRFGMETKDKLLGYKTLGFRLDTWIWIWIWILNQLIWNALISNPLILKFFVWIYFVPRKIWNSEF